MKTIIELCQTMGNGGVENLLRNYLLYNHNPDYQLKLIILWDLPNSLNSSILKKQGIEYDVVFKRKTFFSRILVRFFPKIVSKLISKKMKQYDYSAIHSHMSNLYILKYLIKHNNCKIHYFWTIHSSPSGRYYFGRDKAKLNLAHELSKNSNFHIIALSDGMASELLVKYSFQRISVLYNGIDVNFFSTKPKDLDYFRSSLGIPSDSFLVCNVGRFVEAKNHIFILRVFDEILKVNKKAYLLLVGDDGGTKDYVVDYCAKHNISDRVIITGNRSDVNYILWASDVFFCPSLYEGFPIALIEAQACGLYCVISDHITDDVVIGDVCRLSLETDTKIWTSKILNREPNSFPKHTIQDFDLRTCMERVVDLYGKFIK